MHRFSWSAGLALLWGSAGCGLVLDASARTDASVADDARGIDASVDRVDAPVGELDAPHELDAFEPFEPFDAFVPPEEDAPDPAEPDSLLTALDASLGTSDAFAPDAALSPSSDGGVDGGLDAGRGDGGRPDAGPDASMCTATCPPMATPTSCRATTCIGGRCSPVGGLLTCPPAGTCEQTCEGAMGTLGCAWRGMFCSPPLGACSTDANCTAGGHCAEVGACLHRVCLPSCPTEGAACTFVAEGTTYTGTCDSGNTCRPASIACD